MTEKDGRKKVDSKIVDGSGNEIASHLSADGDYHLGTSMEQNVVADSNNSSTTNLTASETFTGTGTSTLGIVGLQWSLKTSENCTVYIEESDDNSNWDISYSFDYIASKGGRGETVQATKAYWRIRVTNEGLSTTSYFRLAGVLCPIATPLPSALSEDGRLQGESTLVGQQNTERHVWVAPTNALNVIEAVRLVGTNFDGATKDTNFWSEVGTTGTVTQAGKITLATTAAANGTAMYYSVRDGRFVVGSSMLWKGIFNFVTAGTTNNVRRCGAYKTTDGFFFELDGETFSIGTRIGSSDSLISSGNFNGNMGDTWSPTADTCYKLEIEWGVKGAFWYVDGKLLHKITTCGLVASLSLPIKFENVNDAGLESAVVFECFGTTIMREGALATNPTYKHIPSAGTYVCKVGAGMLHGIAINNPSAVCTCTIYDDEAGAGTVIGILYLTAKVITPFFMNYQLPFSTGLTIITDGASDFTVVYE